MRKSNPSPARRVSSRSSRRAPARKRALSARKLAANRRNAQRSTGPRTPRGKQRSSRNAIRHGMFCRDVLLSGEDANLFEALRHQLVEDLRPADLFQQILVERIVTDIWRQRRLLAAERRLYAAQEKRRSDPFGNDVEPRNLAHPDIAADPELEEALLRALEASHAAALPAGAKTAAKVVETIPEAISADQILHELLKRDDAAIERMQRYEQRLALSIARSERILRVRQKPAKGETGPARAARERREAQIVAASEAEIPVAEEHAIEQNEPTVAPHGTIDPPASVEDKAEGDTAGSLLSQNEQNEPTEAQTPSEIGKVKAWPGRP